MVYVVIIEVWTHKCRYGDLGTSFTGIYRQIGGYLSNCFIVIVLTRQNTSHILEDYLLHLLMLSLIVEVQNASQSWWILPVFWARVRWTKVTPSWYQFLLPSIRNLTLCALSAAGHLGIANTVRVIRLFFPQIDA